MKQQFDLNAYGVRECSKKEMQKVRGGFFARSCYLWGMGDNGSMFRNSPRYEVSK